MDIDEWCYIFLGVWLKNIVKINLFIYGKWRDDIFYVNVVFRIG